MSFNSQDGHGFVVAMGSFIRGNKINHYVVDASYWCNLSCLYIVISVTDVRLYFIYAMYDYGQTEYIILMLYKLNIFDTAK